MFDVFAIIIVFRQSKRAFFINTSKSSRVELNY